jgi:hypothetical protein
MKYAIINCVNGNFSVIAEGIETDQSARVQFHDRCKVLWNASDVLTGEVAVVDEQLDVYQGLKELIHHEPQQTAPEPEDDGKDDSGLLNED